MARVERGNVVLKVDDRDVQYYINMGYSLTDESGNILQKAIPTNVGELQTAYLEHSKRIAELEDTVAKLTTQLTTAKKPAKKAESTK